MLALSAPTADQFLEGGFELATLTQPQRKVDFEAPVVLASAPADAPRPRSSGRRAERRSAERAADAMMHAASLKRAGPSRAGRRPQPTGPATDRRPAAGQKPTGKPATRPPGRDGEASRRRADAAARLPTDQAVGRAAKPIAAPLAPTASAATAKDAARPQ